MVEEQRAVAAAMAVALVLTLIVIGTAAATAVPVAGMADRLQAMLRIDVVVVPWLAAAIANVARLRFFSAQDIGGGSAGHDTARVRQGAAILQNTLEQLVLAITVQLVVTAVFGRSVAIVAGMAGLFATGRLLFWIGYRRGARGRALGFALTFYPSVVGLAAAIVGLAAGWR